MTLRAAKCLEGLYFQIYCIIERACMFIVEGFIGLYFNKKANYNVFQEEIVNIIMYSFYP